MTISRHAQLNRDVELAQTYQADAVQAYGRALLMVDGRDKLGAVKPTPKEFAALKAAYDHMMGCHARVQTAIRAVQIEERRLARADGAAKRQRGLRQTLDRQYGDLGPQYGILLDRLVAVACQAEILEQEEPDLFDAEVHAKLVYQTKALIDQLQKHTESVKSEIFTRQLELRVVHVLELVERVIAPESPVLWQRALQSVADALPRLEHVPQLQAEN